MENMCDVPSHLHDHNYPSSRRQKSNKTTKAAGSRKRKRDQESRSRGLEEPPERRLRENGDDLSDRTPSPQPSTSNPQARLEDIRLEVQEHVDDIQHDDVMNLPLFPIPYGPQPGGLLPSDFNAVVEMVMAWMTDSPYNREM